MPTEPTFIESYLQYLSHLWHYAASPQRVSIPQRQLFFRRTIVAVIGAFLIWLMSIFGSFDAPANQPGLPYGDDVVLRAPFTP